MTLFRLDASIRTEGSHSREIADLVEQEWLATHPSDIVTRRHLGIDPVPASAWASAVNGSFVPASDRTPEQQDAATLAAGEVDALVEADALLLAVPLYNFGVSQHFKSWVDLLITDPRLAAGVEPALAGKPAVLVTVRGGSYVAGTPREGWDHATGWMRRILADVWQLDLSVVESEWTLVGVNPALDEFADLAAQARRAAEDQARALGRGLSSARADERRAS